jgi:hypothetical protein
LMQIDEVHVTRIDVRLGFSQLDRDFQHINPFEANDRS